VLVVTRYRDPADPAAFLSSARAALAALAACPGYRWGRIGRALDEPGCWTLVTEWADVGSYRRALGGYEVKLTAVPLLSLALDEPSAFEVLHADGVGSDGVDVATGGATRRAADADTVGLGAAAEPSVPTDLPPGLS
jgi:hypothetical protein